MTTLIDLQNELASLQREVKVLNQFPGIRPPLVGDKDINVRIVELQIAIREYGTKSTKGVC